jgi:hypothetical protein
MMAQFIVRVPIVPVYTVTVEAESAAQAIEFASAIEDLDEAGDRVDSYQEDIDEEVDVTEVEE